MINGTPSKEIHDIEANWAIGFEEANVLFGTSVTSLEVGHPVLLTNQISTVRFRLPVRYGGIIIFRKIRYGYGEDICFIKTFYILLCIYFSYIDKHM